MTPLSPRIATLPKAELHIHLEGSVRPEIVRTLAARHGVTVSAEEVAQRYAYPNFLEFLQSFKWVTSFLREPADYALIAADLGKQLLQQNVVYAEVTISIGVMLLRNQNVEANFAALSQAAAAISQRGLRMNWIFDAVRQFGAASALEVVNSAKRCHHKSIVAFGIGGDELSIPTEDFRSVYAAAANIGLHRLIHAGEIGGPEKIREAIELLGVERIGHGIAAIHDPALMDLLADRRIPLEICPSSNICTGALARQLNRPIAKIADHPLPQLLRHGVPVALSTDDPSMFHTTLADEYQNAAAMGLTDAELTSIAQTSFDHAFGAPPK
ncbi:MAG TPA: adenosine deaminase [Candidatus Acidoferrum sp.]|jgi:adenosine deaminase